MLGLQSDNPRLADGLFSMKIDGYTLYYNPLGYGGVVLADKDSQELIELANGSVSQLEISAITGRPQEEIQRDIDVLVDRGFLRVESRADDVRKYRPEKSLTCWLHLTNSCNLACEYCYIHRSPGNMSLDTARTIVDKMISSCRRAGISAISLKFSGGEPLLRFGDLKEIVRYTESVRGDIKARYVILTNSTLVTEEIADYLAEHSFGVGTSLDGLEAVHDLARHTPAGEGSFMDAVSGINLLIAKGIRPSVNVTVSEFNYRDILPLTEMILDQGWKFRYSLERDTNDGSPAVLQHEEAVISELMACYDLIEDRLPNRDITKIHQFGDVVFNRSVNRACGAGASFFAVGYDGQLGSCGLGLADPRGSVHDEGDLLENVQGHNSSFALGVAKKYEDCSRCPWRGSCAGACPLQTISTYGRHDVRSPYCAIYKAALPRILRIKGLQMIQDYEQDMIGGGK